MGTAETRTDLLAHQSRSTLSKLSLNRLKRGTLLYWAVLCTLGTSIIHLVGVVKQPPQSGLLAALLLGGALVQAVIALAVVALPSGRLLIVAAVVQGAGVLLWIVTHSRGLPIGPTIWRAETLSTLDLYLPAMEGVSAFFFLCLFGRTLSMASRTWRTILAVLPSLLIVGFLVWAALHYKAAELYIAIFILTAGLPDSLLELFLPAVGLLVVALFLRIVIRRLRTLTPGAWRTALLVVPALFMISLLTWAGGYNAANAAWFPSSSTVHAPVGQTTLAYCTSGGNPLALDLAEPTAQAARPA
ncbi:MAG: hypothetical protein H0X37_24890, partial [Herpetosiphonaceae bacterium]|nr:hypothetical protein [Herpetosiphonaceae bacterium]